MCKGWIFLGYFIWLFIAVVVFCCKTSHNTFHLVVHSQNNTKKLLGYVLISKKTRSWLLIMFYHHRDKGNLPICFVPRMNCNTCSQSSGEWFRKYLSMLKPKLLFQFVRSTAGPMTGEDNVWADWGLKPTRFGGKTIQREIPGRFVSSWWI